MQQRRRGPQGGPGDLRGRQADRRQRREGLGQALRPQGRYLVRRRARASERSGRSRRRPARPSTTSASSTRSCRARSRSSRPPLSSEDPVDRTPGEPELAGGARLSRRVLLSGAAGGAVALGAPRCCAGRVRSSPPRPGGEAEAVPRRAADPAGARRRRPAPADGGGGDPDPAGAPDEDVDLRRRLPRADDPPALGAADERDVRAPPRQEGGRADRPPARRAQPARARRPARRADEEPADVPVLRPRSAPRAGGVRQRPADLAGRGAPLHLRVHGERQPGAGHDALVPRPPPRPDRARTSGTGSPGCGSSRTRSRPRCPCPGVAARSRCWSPTGRSTRRTSSPIPSAATLPSTG